MKRTNAKKNVQFSNCTTVRTFTTSDESKSDPVKTKLQLALEKYNPITNIPRDTITLFINTLINVTRSTKLKFGVAGSYRRGLSHSGDIDFILIAEKKESVIETIDAFKQCISYASQNEVITIAAGIQKQMILTKLDKRYIKIDIFVTNAKEYPFMLLYATGNKIFNIKIRNEAKKQGFLLNQKGLFIEGTRVENVKFNSERSILLYLGIDKKYVNPELREIT